MKRIKKIMANLAQTEGNSLSVRAMKQTARFLINGLYALATRGNIFGTVVISDYALQVMITKHEDPDDFDFTSGIIVGGILTMIVILFEIIKRYSDQAECRQLEQEQTKLIESNNGLEDKNKILRDALPIFAALVNMKETLVQANISLANLPKIEREKFKKFKPEELSLEKSKKSKTHFWAYGYKGLTGLVQDFPQAVITSLLFSYLFNYSLMKQEPLENMNLTMSSISACVTGIFVSLMVMMQRNGLETEIADHGKMIHIMKLEMERHYLDFQSLREEHKRLWKSYKELDEHQGSEDPESNLLAKIIFNKIAQQTLALNAKLEKSSTHEVVDIDSEATRTEQTNETTYLLIK